MTQYAIAHVIFLEFMDYLWDFFLIQCRCSRTALDSKDTEHLLTSTHMGCSTAVNLDCNWINASIFPPIGHSVWSSGVDLAVPGC